MKNGNLCRERKGLYCIVSQRPSRCPNLSRFGMSAWLRYTAHEYRLAAAGHCDLLFYNKLMPWDHAAGWLLHRESGGYSAHFDGTAYHPTHLTGGLICAPDAASWQFARDALLE
jgi:fructose-1,6-bisphosphatase/inositol monophosphatase family enzyme